VRIAVEPAQAFRKFRTFMALPYVITVIFFFQFFPKVPFCSYVLRY